MMPALDPSRLIVLHSSFFKWNEAVYLSYATDIRQNGGKDGPAGEIQEVGFRTGTKGLSTRLQRPRCLLTACS